MHTHRLYNSDYTKEVKAALDSAIKTVSVVTPTSRATPTVTGTHQRLSHTHSARTSQCVCTLSTLHATLTAKHCVCATGPDDINVFWMSWAPVGLLPSVYLDMLFALASMAFIFLYITFNVGSLILACAAMFEILMSIPLALTLWKIVLGQDNIDFLQVRAKWGFERATPLWLHLRPLLLTPVCAPVHLHPTTSFSW